MALPFFRSPLPDRQDDAMSPLPFKVDTRLQEAREVDLVHLTPSRIGFFDMLPSLSPSAACVFLLNMDPVLKIRERQIPFMIKDHNLIFFAFPLTARLPSRVDSRRTLVFPLIRVGVD